MVPIPPPAKEPKIDVDLFNCCSVSAHDHHIFQIFAPLDEDSRRRIKEISDVDIVGWLNGCGSCADFNG